MISARFPRSRAVPGYRPDFARPPRTWRPTLVGAAAVLAAVLLGWLAGSVLHHPAAPPATTPERLVAVGDVNLQLEGSWAPARAAKGIAATRLPGLSAYAPVPGLPGRVWVARGPIDGPTLLPAALRSQIPVLSAPTKVMLDGRPAWHYPSMQLRGGGLLEVTTLPTATGVLLVACQADETSWNTVAGCAAGVRAIDGAAPLAPDATLAFRAHLGPVIAKLNAARAGAGRALGRAAHARGQRAAAQHLAAAHQAAAVALSPFAPATGPARTAVVRLSATAAAYAKLAAAAQRRDRPAYGQARAAAGRSDQTLRAALAASGR